MVGGVLLPCPRNRCPRCRYHQGVSRNLQHATSAAVLADVGARTLQFDDVIASFNTALQATIPHDAENELYEESMLKGEQGFEAALALCPDLNTVGIKSWVHGPDTHSVDHEPIMGRCLFTENAYVATGFNSQGIQLGPGIGRAMADCTALSHRHLVNNPMRRHYS